MFLKNGEKFYLKQKMGKLKNKKIKKDSRKYVKQLKNKYRIYSINSLGELLFQL